MRPKHTAPWGFLLVAATFLIVTVNHLFSEKIAVNRGLGWDGSFYGAWAADFPEQVLSKGLDAYYTGRMLPSGLVYYTLGLLGVERTPEHIVHAFGALNIACITVAGGIWVLIARQLSLSLAGLVLGYIGLFVNFFILKWSPYYPVLTDVPAYLIGFLTLYFYLARRTWALLATTLAGAFVWPTALYLGGLLLLFPREPTSDTDAPASHRTLPVVAATGLAMILLATIVYLFSTGWLLPNAATQPVQATLVPSVLITVASAWLGVWRLLDGRKLFEPSYWLRRLRSPDFYIVVASLAAIKVTQGLLSTEVPSAAHEKFHFAILAMTSIARPGAFLVAHALFYGPIVLLTLILWQPMCRLIHLHGIGLTLAATLGVIIGIGSESRDLVNVMPLIVPFAVLASGSLPARASFVWPFLLLALAFSKFWLRINFTGDPTAYPTRLFWTNGPWISTIPYFIQAAAVVMWGLVLWIVCQHPNTASRQLSESHPRYL